MTSRLVIEPIEGIPEVTRGADLAGLIAAARPDLADGDVVVVTQKVVSKAEGRMVAVDPDDPHAYAAVVETECVRVLRRLPCTATRAVRNRAEVSKTRGSPSPRTVLNSMFPPLGAVK